MRRTADSIKGDLDATRAELKKGVLEMPQEAKESTTAIRRAVGEQIKALKELSDIVAKSGRSIDVSDTSPPPEQPKPTPPRRLVPPQPRAAERKPDPAPKAEKPRPQTEEPRPKTGAWVRDLLSGAARAESEDGEVTLQPQRAEPRPSTQVADSLNSLSVDIARAIDHDAAIELWSRYRRGDRDVFTRRLYTLKGQQTFDEIRRKYQTDAEFRAAVDRYCEDFEKLLKDVARNDRDNKLTQTYLSSDTGKVYTMLAHAAGRLR